VDAFIPSNSMHRLGVGGRKISFILFVESADTAVVLMLIEKIRKLASCYIEIPTHSCTSFSLVFYRLFPSLIFSIVRVYDELLHAD
jgi:hypothetical protein